MAAQIDRSAADIAQIIAKESKYPELQDLLSRAAKVRPSHDFDLISKAYRAAELAHRNQKRKSGDLTITHAAAVGRILIGLNLDSITISAGLLHDVVEDTGVPISQVAAEFGQEIADLVDGVTKIRDLTFQTPEAEQAENFRKMLLSTAQDIRVVLIKFADRLHNLRTLEYLRPETREQMAQESRDIYAPLAHRLGIARIRAELEDLSLKWLEPEAYQDLHNKINLTREERESYIEEVRAPLLDALGKAGIQADIRGRPKNFYSIHRKIVNQGKAFEEIYDLLAMRILVSTESECYNALGLVHSMYTPVMARFKDFIATPKSNRYQSLHTTVIGPRGMMLEVQIRTREMHQIAEVGIAAHWRYKEGKRNPSELDRHMAWLRSLLEWQTETTDPHEFIEELKVDLFPDEIYVFTPRGDLIQLPEGATPVDFAFAVHTDVGLHCTGARVDGQMVALSTPLETGKTVEVMTSPHQRPSRDWLSFVKSPKARSRIKRWLRIEEHAHSVRLGEEILERELKRQRKRLDEDRLKEVASELGVPGIDHLYAGIGNGDFSLERVFHRLFPSTRPAVKRTRTDASRRQKKSPIKIHGLNNLMIHFAGCCRPVLGDPVLGIITKGQGVSVHRRDCPNANRKDLDAQRVVDLEWDPEQDEAFAVQIEVKGTDRPKFLRDVTQAIADLGVHVVGGELKTTHGRVGDRFTVEVKDRSQLNTLFKRVLAVHGVSSVHRVDTSEDDGT
ncbi:MAG: bifunctional (p)ppGpp synthetase/guanosine-3',5'-bis(diphosphate) 3'-pyrophosphohydrolase [Candidatus Latescibacteria bacterium]|nr:bifunctional (p)ppGpp synthetase/guanosine-3',5'-bis(diphosphate) 3'-pyrophosphohydrolase [Candidatus Latescibacterota bacterium]